MDYEFNEEGIYLGSVRLKHDGPKWQASITGSGEWGFYSERDTPEEAIIELGSFFVQMSTSQETERIWSHIAQEIALLQSS
jgi:hypothetical protein